MEIPRYLTPHTVTVQDKTGDGAYGPVFDPPRTLQHVQAVETTRLVRAADGSEVVSSAQVITRPEHGPIPAGSLLTLPSGRNTTVISVEFYDIPPAPTHRVLNCE